MEEEYIQQLCEDIIRLKPDVVITEKGVSGGLCSCQAACHGHGRWEMGEGG